MNEKDIKRLYKAGAAETAPDMEALWRRIESGLEEKDAIWRKIESGLEGGTEERNVEKVSPVPAKKKPRLSRFSVIGTAAAVIIILPLAAGIIAGGTAKDAFYSNSAAQDGVSFAAAEAAQENGGELCSVEKVQSSSVAASYDRTETYRAENDWEIRISADKTVISEGEPLNAYAELEYVGSEAEITVQGSVFCMYFRLVGDRYFADGQGSEIIPDVLVEHSIKKGEPLRRNYMGLTAFSQNDPDADFYRKFGGSDEVILPKGNYTLTVYTDILTESGERINKSASVDITVK